ncbi:Kiwa anti-phage protein KwaB-like domain-containing protein, partial [Actinoplanes utahensis]
RNVQDFLVQSDGEPKRHEDGRYRDFIVAKSEREEDRSYDFGEIDLPSESLDRLHSLVNKRIGAKLGQIASHEVEPVRYGEAKGDRRHLRYITEDELPLIGRFEEIFSEREVGYTTYEEMDPDFQAIRIMDSEDGMVIGFQHYWGNQLLGNTSLFNIWTRGGELTPIDDPIISIPKRLDAVYYDGVLYIFDNWRFEQMFDYHEVYEEVAENVLGTLREGDIRFGDMDLVESGVLNNPNMMRKLRDVQENGLYEELDMDDIEWVLGEYPNALDGIHIDGVADDREIVLENKLKIWGLIHILNDDHVVSSLTNRAYQASNKEEI